MSSLMLRSSIFVIGPILVSLACDRPSGGGNPQRTEPISSSAPDAEGKKGSGKTGDSNKIRIEPNTETTVNVHFSQCLDGSQVESKLFVPDYPTQNDPRPSKIKTTGGGCSKTVEISLPALPPTELGLESIASRDGVVIETRTLDLIVGEGNTKDPTPEVTATPAPTPNAEWPGEPDPETMCDKEDCNKVIARFVNRGTLRVATSFTTLEKVGELTFFPTSPTDTSTGLFAFTSKVSFSPQLLKGEYAIRNGRLALRSQDKKLAAYFTWYPVDNNGHKITMLFAAMMEGKKETSVWLL